MPQVTKEQIAQAKRIDLLSYLKMYEPNNLVHVSGPNYCTKEHDSLKISNGKWNWFSRGIGGKTALKYLIEVRNMVFVDAVMTLCKEPVQLFEPNVQQKVKQFQLPKAFKNNDRVIHYLKKRGISSKIIQHCIENKLIYESENYHNAVFVGYDDKRVARYAALRGTWESGKAFKGEVSGSDKRYSFCMKTKQNSHKLIVTESAIDVLSVAMLKKNPFDSYYLSLGGVYASKDEKTTFKMPKALVSFLENYLDISQITLCLDNDATGHQASKIIARRFAEKGYTVINKPPRSSKDYNEFLKKTNSYVKNNQIMC